MKTYYIEVRPEDMASLIDELNHWRVNPTRYEQTGNIIKTRDPNVVDVALETFGRNVKITVVLK